MSKPTPAMRALMAEYERIRQIKRLNDIATELGIPVATLVGLRDGTLVAVCASA